MQNTGDETADPVQVEAVIAERERLSRLVSDVAVALIQSGSLQSILSATVEAIVRHLDAAFARIWTLNPEQSVLELQASSGDYTHLDGAHSRVPLGQFKIGRIAQERKPHLTNDVLTDPRVHDHEWARREGLISFAGYPLIVDDTLVGVVAMFARQPLTGATLEALTAIANGIALGIDRKKAEAELREQTEIVETVHLIGQMLAAELDLKKLVQAVTDAATELTRAEFGAFFYNLLDENGASYTLYTLSGVPLEKFADFPMPRATEVFGPTFRGETTIRANDIRQDPRYGKSAPYFGMPPGHLPVASYLAVSVISRSGEVLGGLFFGHSEKGVFQSRDERIVEGLSAQAAVAMDNARLFDAVQRERIKAESAARDNEHLYNEAQNANRMKDEFLATVSHELRTPLTAILGWTNLLTSGSLGEEDAARALATIDRSAHAQAQIIEDILDISRISSGKLRLNVRLIDPGGVIESAVESIRPAAEAKGIRLHMLLDPQAGPVSGDPDRLQQVVWNLVSNAVKFTPKGGRVQVRLECINSHLEIAVSDTGNGIEADFLPYVFDRFRQADSSSSRTHGGLGLGLAIVRQLVEMHGGSVTVASPGEGQGATFTVLLPLSVMHNQRTSDSEERVHPKVGKRHSLSFPNTSQLEGVRVLTVDDEEDTRVLLAFVLEQCGAEVRVAASVAEALEVLANFNPDILISDIGMPGADGYELIRQVRERETAENLKRIPAVALTAYARTEDRMRVLAAGFQMHVPKPVEPAELVAVAVSLAGWKSR